MDLSEVTTGYQCLWIVSFSIGEPKSEVRNMSEVEMHKYWKWLRIFEGGYHTI